MEINQVGIEFADELLKFARALWQSATFGKESLVAGFVFASAFGPKQ